MTRLVIAAVCLVAVLVAAWQIDRRATLRAEAVAADRVATARESVAAAHAANATNLEAILQLRAALQACQAARVYDVAMERATLAALRDDLGRLEAAAATATARRQALHAGECRTWAEQPACGVMP